MRQKIGRTSRFTIWHGITASLALHLAFAAPFFVVVEPPPPEPPPLLVLDFQGLVADNQSEQKMLEETKGAAKPDQPEKEQVAEAAPAEAPPPDDPPRPVAEEGDTPPPPPPVQAETPPAAATPSGSAGAENIKGAEERREAQTMRNLQREKDRINAYVTLLGKKVRANLVRPNDGRSAATVVAFTVLDSGQIRPGSLKIAESSGQTALDDSALKTIRASAPFDPPPRELNLAIAVDFTKKR